MITKIKSALFGLESIPVDWKTCLARHGDINDLAERLAKKISGD